ARGEVGAAVHGGIVERAGQRLGFAPGEPTPGPRVAHDVDRRLSCLGSGALEELEQEIRRADDDAAHGPGPILAETGRRRKVWNWLPSARQERPSWRRAAAYGVRRRMEATIRESGRAGRVTLRASRIRPRTLSEIRSCARTTARSDRPVRRAS